MNTKEKINNKVRKILLEEWDPIGINYAEGCEDEYDSYIPYICDLITSGKQIKDLIEYLSFIESEYMGLGKRDGYLERIIRVANILNKEVTRIDN